MAKRTAGIWIEEADFERLKRIAVVDRRSVSQVMLMALERGLPLIEEEIKQRRDQADVLAATVSGALEAAKIQKRSKPASTQKP